MKSINLSRKVVEAIAERPELSPFCEPPNTVQPKGGEDGGYQSKA